MFKELLAKIARSLKKHKMPYMVIGGQAVLLYGEPRMTKDIDITLGLQSSKLDELLEVTKELGIAALPDKPDQFVARTGVLPSVHQPSGIRIDFIFSSSAYESHALKRANRVKIDDTEVCFASVEDLVIHKMIAGRPRDIEDVMALLLKNTGIDVDYVLNWLKQFDEALARDSAQRFDEIRQRLGGKS